MDEGSHRIVLLPDSIRAQVLSSSDLGTPEQVVEGLIRNALDAEAQLVVVEADFSRGCISVCDDGHGISGTEFSGEGNLAKPSCSSKANASRPLYGCRGRFLASLSALCILSIASRTRSENTASRLIYHRGSVVKRQVGMHGEELGLGRQGTKVIVHNLFGDIPVRRKQLSSRYSSVTETERAFVRLKEIFTGYLLAYARVVEAQLSLKGDRQFKFCCTSSKEDHSRFGLEPTVLTLLHAEFVKPFIRDQWRLASIRTSQVIIRAAICTIASPSKRCQFISVGQDPLRRDNGGRVLFDTVERLFEASDFALVQVDTRSGENEQEQPLKVSIEPARFGTVIDRFPSFYIRIDSKSESSLWPLGRDESPAETVQIINHLVSAVESLVIQFLSAFNHAPSAITPEAGKRHARRCRGDVADAPRAQEGKSQASLQVATEVRYFRLRNKVKSAQPLKEDFRYTLGFSNSKSAPAGTSVETCLPRDGDIRQVSSPHVDDSTGDIVDAEELSSRLAWTNPRHGRVSHLDPRTGAVTSIATTRQTPLSSIQYVQTGRRLEYTDNCTPRPSLTTSRTSGARYSRIDLQKIVGQSFPTRSEATITSMSSLSPWSFPGGQSITPVAHDLSVSEVVTKDALSGADIIKQVDRKFILAVVHAMPTAKRPAGGGRLVVLIDQHAADERVNFEQLCQDFCMQSRTKLAKALVFEIDESEVELFRAHATFFRQWSLDYTTIHRGEWQLKITHLPGLIAERCRAEPKLLIALIRQEVWSNHANYQGWTVSSDDGHTKPWWSIMHKCPGGMVEMLKSRSCRTAIMFNDALATDQCRELVGRLSRCTFPFQCAHGRPTLTVVADLDEMAGIKSDEASTLNWRGVLSGYGDSWNNWIAGH